MQYTQFLDMFLWTVLVLWSLQMVQETWEYLQRSQWSSAAVLCFLGHFTEFCQFSSFLDYFSIKPFWQSQSHWFSVLVSSCWKLFQCLSLADLIISVLFFSGGPLTTQVKLVFPRTLVSYIPWRLSSTSYGFPLTPIHLSDDVMLKMNKPVVFFKKCCSSSKARTDIGTANIWRVSYHLLTLEHNEPTC